MKTFFIALIALSFTACNTPESGSTNSGDAGDSTSIGAGTDTAGTLVDTGSAVTDTSVNKQN